MLVCVDTILMFSIFPGRLWQEIFGEDMANDNVAALVRSHDLPAVAGGLVTAMITSGPPLHSWVFTQLVPGWLGWPLTSPFISIWWPRSGSQLTCGGTEQYNAAFTQNQQQEDLGQQPKSCLKRLKGCKRIW